MLHGSYVCNIWNYKVLSKFIGNDLEQNSNKKLINSEFLENKLTSIQFLLKIVFNDDSVYFF